MCWNLGFTVGGLMPTFVNLVSPNLSDVPGRLMVFLVANVISPATRCGKEAEAPRRTK